MSSVPPITVPFTVAIDTREQSPFQFQGFKADSRHQPTSGETRYLYIPTEVRTLKTGDYSIPGMESEIAIERKSLQDLFGTLGGGRERFVRELERLAELQVAHIVVEASWTAVLTDPPTRSKLPPKTVFRSVTAWQQEFRTVHWDFMDSRSFAEHKTFRILERFWNQKQKDSTRMQ